MRRLSFGTPADRAQRRQLLKQLVHRLRQKIEADAAEPRYLATVSGVGYVLRAEGTAVET